MLLLFNDQCGLGHGYLDVGSGTGYWPVETGTVKCLFCEANRAVSRLGVLGQCAAAIAFLFRLPVAARLICRWQRLRCDPAQPSTPPNSEAQPNWPAISILVPAYNEGSVIAAKIENLVAMDYPADRIECLIFDDGSSDETVAVAEHAISGVMARSASVFRYVSFEVRRDRARQLPSADWPSRRTTLYGS